MCLLDEVCVLERGKKIYIPHVKNTNWRFVSYTDLIFLWHGFFMSHFIKEYPSLIAFFLDVLGVNFKLFLFYPDHCE